MQFTLKMSLDNAEAQEAGPDVAVPDYLRKTAERIEDGNLPTGMIRDGNGNTIGAYEITGD